MIPKINILFSYWGHLTVYWNCFKYSTMINNMLQSVNWNCKNQFYCDYYGFCNICTSLHFLRN